VSNAVYPVLPGRTHGANRRVIAPPVTVRTTPSQREYRSRDATLTRYRYSVPYEWLRTKASTPELQTLVSFYVAHGGAFESWLYTDPDDKSVTAQPFGTGNGTATAFKLLRSFGSNSEPIDAVNGTPLVYIDGTPTTAFTIAAGSGVITFTTAPTAGALLTWTGSFYRRCRFLGDGLDTDKFMAGLFSAKRVEFISTKT